MTKGAVTISAIFLGVSYPVLEQEPAHREMFSCQGVVKSVGQVVVRFSEQTVPFGDPWLIKPFAINCPERKRGHWPDGRN